MSPTARRRSALVEVSGATRAPAPRVVAAIGMAGAMLLLAGCSPFPEDGVVVSGADGEEYILPDGTERPVYASKDDCIADVSEQIRLLRAEGTAVDASPDQLCESSDGYRGHYGAGLWLGPLLFSGSRWDSSRVSSWAPVTGGGFAKPGSTAHSDVVERAPAGAKVGERAPLSGGFGSSAKSGGFGSSVKGSHSGSFGG
ncbi:hypothetical protein J2X63_003011 [Agromyces sp. 3263]|uniref:hypothetical protein n=1 Tax=Agromyces sp. 3263 TaxID=2817750 RepID=UPI0028590D17|nr:hypothetical protein [Agromyces sp. 3263]MDR6907303.1 hypothetical protein [Agromyces sp. 3263]